MADAAMFIGIVAGWAFLRAQTLSWRQWWYRYWYLRSRHWQELRKRKLASIGYRCEKCRTRGRLDVHHLTYKRIGHEKLNDLQVLCRTCHRKEHGK